MFLNDTVCEYDIKTEKLRQKKLDLSGTLLEPAFEMKDERIRLYDFSDNYYEIDCNGKVIRD